MVPRYNPLSDRIDAANFQEEDAKLQAHNSYAVERYRTLRNTLKDHHYRPVMVDRWTSETGKQLARQEQHETARQTAAKRLNDRLRRRSQTAKMPAEVIYRAPETIEYLDDYSSGLAEMNQEIEKGKE